MKKQLIALRGRSSVGKSSTLHLLYKLLIANSTTRPIHFEAFGRKLDFVAIVSIEGRTVGLFNRGDIPETVRKLLEQLAAENCQIIVCAARTKGKIEDVLKSQGRKYKLTEVSKEPAIGKSYAISNNAAAHNLAAIVYSALDA